VVPESEAPGARKLRSMCGRFTQARPEPELADLFEAEDLTDLPAGRYNVAPTDPVAVVVERDHRRALTAYRWGLVPRWAEHPKVGGRMINARAETLERSPAFGASFARKRCLIPVDGFYEWLRSPEGQREPYYITSNDGSPLALAGLWSSWRPAGDDGPPLRTCAIVTTAPNELMAPIHNRMPLIVPRGSWDLWLDTTIDRRPELRGLLEPSPADGLLAYPVGLLVNNVRNNGQELIRPLGERVTPA
jgi:putative SOS response-associated peptidase YedK